MNIPTFVPAAASICVAALAFSGCGGWASPSPHSGYLSQSVAPAGVKPAPAHGSEKIIYTPSDVGCVIEIDSGGCSFPIDLNNDAVSDFTISEDYYQGCGSLGCRTYGYVSVIPTSGNGVVAVLGFATALDPGEQIGPSQSFEYGTSSLWTFGDGRGYWLNNGAHYLGLVFQIAGKTHYGWAKLQATGNSRFLDTNMRGYAYEAKAGKSILAGQKK